MENTPQPGQDYPSFNPLDVGLDLNNPKDLDRFKESAGDLGLFMLLAKDDKLREKFDGGELDFDQYHAAKAQLDKEIIDRQVELGLLSPDYLIPPKPGEQGRP